MSSAVWPAPTDWSSRAPVTAAYLFATCVLSVFVAKRITTFAALRTLSLARALVVLVLVESLLFILVKHFTPAQIVLVVLGADLVFDRSRVFSFSVLELRNLCWPVSLGALRFLAGIGARNLKADSTYWGIRIWWCIIL